MGKVCNFYSFCESEANVRAEYITEREKESQSARQHQSLQKASDCPHHIVLARKHRPTVISPSASTGRAIDRAIELHRQTQSTSKTRSIRWKTACTLLDLKCSLSVVGQLHTYGPTDEEVLHATAHGKHHHLTAIFTPRSLAVKTAKSCSSALALSFPSVCPHPGCAPHHAHEHVY